MTDVSLILASASRSRQNLLNSAGVNFKAVPAAIDEEIIKHSFLSDHNQDPANLPLLLAETKAQDVSRRFPTSWVIGADQVLILDGKIYNKPQSLHAAREQLLSLKNKTHRLETSLALAHGGQTAWTYSDASYLTMRDFSIDALGHYLATAGAEVCDSVGGYKIEGPAIQLFDRIAGDFFSIIGLPLLPLLTALRRHDLLPK